MWGEVEQAIRQAAEGKPVLRSLLKYHGKPGSGASVEFKIKEGPITMLSIGVMPIPPATRTIGRGESSIRKK